MEFKPQVKHRSASGSAVFPPYNTKSKTADGLGLLGPILQKNGAAPFSVSLLKDRIASDAWRTCSSLSEKISITNATTGFGNASHWRVHDSKPYMLFTNSGAESNTCTVVGFDAKVAKSLPQSERAYSADFNGSVIVMGDQEGTTHVARLDWSDFNSNFVWQKYLVTGGSVHPNIDVVVCSKAERAFAVMENSVFHLWDYNRKDMPLHSVKIWSFGQKSVSADVDNESGTLCLVGSNKGDMQLLDYRIIARSKSASPWKITSPYNNGFVSSIVWHPHVPHWFASAGDNGSIHVWDTRSLKQSVSSINLAHGAGVSGISWCPTHSEMLASMGVDRELSLWNFRLDDEARGAACVAAFCASRPLGVCWLDGAVAASDSRGRVTKGTLSRAFLSPMCPASLGKEEIHSLLYVRDLADAFQRVVQEARALMQDNRHQEALELVEFCYPRSLSVKELTSEAAVAFKEDILLVASYLPPSYPISAKAVKPLRMIKKLRIILHLEQLKLKNQWKEAFNYTDEICKYIKKSAKRGSEFTIAPDIVTSIVEMVLRHHNLSGLTMGCKILRILSEEEFGKHSSLTLLLLSPTVFDGYLGGMAQSSTDLAHVLGNQKVGLSQVDFVRDFTARVWTENPFHRIEKMMRKTEKTLTSVSSFVNRVYLGSLLQTGDFAKFFLVAGTIANAAPNCEFSSVIIPKHIFRKGVPMAMEWIKVVQDELKTNFDLKKAKALTSLCAAIIIRAAPILPAKTVAAAAKVLQSLVKYIPGKEAHSVSAAIFEISQSPTEEPIKMFLSLLQLKVN